MLSISFALILFSLKDRTSSVIIVKKPRARTDGSQIKRLLNNLPYKVWLNGLSEGRTECKKNIRI